MGALQTARWPAVEGLSAWAELEASLPLWRVLAEPSSRLRQRRRSPLFEGKMKMKQPELGLRRGPALSVAGPCEKRPDRGQSPGRSQSPGANKSRQDGAL